MAVTTGTKLTAKIEPFDTFWEAPDNIEKGYYTFGMFYKYNYLKYFPDNKNSNILIISCGPGYLVKLLNDNGYDNVLGIDSMETKIQPALDRNLNCKSVTAFDFLEQNNGPFDVIFCEQEINHLTKDEILRLLDLCKQNLREGGTLIIHSLNGANPVVGAENFALNFDHYNTFTEASLIEVLEFCKFHQIKVIPLKLYVFYRNPLNYVGIVVDSFLNILFRLLFTFYGKKTKIFSKKIAAICRT